MIGQQTFRNVQDTTMKFTGTLLGAGRNVWLAGLGTVATVEEEVTSVFGQLVEKGEKYDKQRSEAMTQVVGGARERVTGTTKRVEEAFSGMATGTLHRLGVPTREEIQSLITRVETLTSKVEALAQK